MISRPCELNHDKDKETKRKRQTCCLEMLHTKKMHKFPHYGCGPCEKTWIVRETHMPGGVLRSVLEQPPK